MTPIHKHCTAPQQQTQMLLEWVPASASGFYKRTLLHSLLIAVYACPAAGALM
jgi:hypothetical protein